MNFFINPPPGGPFVQIVENYSDTGITGQIISVPIWGRKKKYETQNPKTILNPDTTKILV